MKDPSINIINGPDVYFSLNIRADGGLYEPILDGMGAPVGERYQLPVDQDGTRLGTILGYSFIFPSLNSTGVSGQNRNGNRHLYLKDGDLIVFNEVCTRQWCL